MSPINDLDLLRRVRDDVAEPSPVRLAPARERLLERTAAGRARRRRTPLLIAGAAAVVLAVATGLVVSDPVSTPPATAADVLHRAAERAGDLPALGDGQYLAVETREDALGYVDRDGRIVGAYRTRSVSTTYVPQDRSDTWVRRSWSEAPQEFYGGARSRRVAAQDYAASSHVDDPGVERAPGGHFGNGELGGGDGGLDADDIASLPRDPRRLLERLESSGGVGDSPRRAAIEGAAILLRTGLVPLDLRRALYRALALVPGVRIVDEALTMSGRPGTAVGVRVDDYEWSIVIDRRSGDFLGELQTQAVRMGAVPSGTIAYRTAVSASVVDGVPVS